MKRSEMVEIVRDGLRRFNRRAGVLKSDPYGLGLSLSQSSALVDIERFRGLRPNDLVKLLNLEKSSVSRLINVLEERGLIEISSDPRDGRSKMLELTKAGKKAVIVIGHVSNSSIGEAFDYLTATEQSDVVDAFRKFSAAIERASRDTDSPAATI